MDPLSMFLYFGVPTTVGLIGLAAVKLHERSAPPEAVGDNSDEEYVPAFVRKSDIREATDCRRIVAPWSNTAVPMLTLRKAAGHTAEDLTPEYVRWFRETYGQTVAPFCAQSTANRGQVETDRPALMAASLTVMAGRVPAIHPRRRSADGRDTPGHDGKRRPMRL